MSALPIKLLAYTLFQTAVGCPKFVTPSVSGINAGALKPPNANDSDAGIKLKSVTAPGWLVSAISKLIFLLVAVTRIVGTVPSINILN